MKIQTIEWVRSRESLTSNNVHWYAFTHFLTLLNDPIAIRASIDPRMMELIVYHLQCSYFKSTKGSTLTQDQLAALLKELFDAEIVEVATLDDEFYFIDIYANSEFWKCCHSEIMALPLFNTPLFRTKLATLLKGEKG